MSENVNITIEEADEIVLELLGKYKEWIQLDVEEFLDLLKNSLSLNTQEKKRVIDAVPTLSQFQFDELKKVFLEEREKFRELAWEHPEDIKKLLSKQQSEWLALWDLYKVEMQKQEVSNEDEQKIDDIKKSLGL